MSDPESPPSTMSRRVWPIVRIVVLSLIFFIGIIGNLAGLGTLALIVDVLRLASIDYHGKTLSTIEPRGAVIVLCVLIATNLAIVLLAWRFLDRKRLPELWLDVRAGWGRALGLGLLVGLSEVLLTTGGLALSGGVTSTWVFGTGSVVAWGVAAGWLAASCILAPLSEEIWYRGYILQNINRGWGITAAAAISALLFGGLHLANPNAEWLGAVNIALSGLLWTLGILLTKSLWFAIGAHAAWNFAQFFVFGLPNSGFTVSRLGLEGATLFKATLAGPRLLTWGEFGMEASIVFTVVQAGLIVLLFALYKRRGQAADAR